MSHKAHRAKKTDSHPPNRVSQTRPGQGHARFPIVVVLAIAAFLVLAVGGVLLSRGESPASTVVASADLSSSPVVAATPTAVAQVSQPATQAPTQAAAAPAVDTQGKTAVTAQDGVVKLALADVSDGKAHFYTYESAGKIIPFFVLKSSDGVIRAAFDACDVCFPARLGYHQEGDEMVCNNCGSRFPSVKINEVKGGCNPAPLIRQAAGDLLAIQVTDLEAGARYF